jgi:hypothetical protein
MLLTASMAVGQPCRQVMLLNPHIPSIPLLTTVKEEYTKAFGMRDILKTFPGLFNSDFMHGVNEGFGVNLTRRFGTTEASNEAVSKYLPHIKVKEQFYVNLLFL